jgi:hypothetical protein
LTADFFYRVLTWHSAKVLPSVGYVRLGKKPFADRFFNECGTWQSLCRVPQTLGKAAGSSSDYLVESFKFEACVS